MSGRMWHKGPPPHVGWWNASATRSRDCWRWWDGKQWSSPAFPWQDLGSVQHAAKVLSQNFTVARIEWRTYWPKLARVKRVAP